MNDYDLSSSLGDYIKVIKALSAEGAAVHASDVAKALGVSKPSVTGALRLLAARELVSYTPYSPISLTPLGLEVADEIGARYGVVRDFLVRVLQLNEAEAADASHKLEHTLAPSVFSRLSAFIEYMERCPSQQIRWSDSGHFVCMHHNQDSNCALCTIGGRRPTQ